MLRFYKTNVGRPGKLLLYLAGLAALGGCATTPAPSRTAFMALGAATPAPIAFLDFCARRPDECRATPSGIIKTGDRAASVARAAAPGWTASARVVMTGSLDAARTPTAMREQSVLAAETRWPAAPAPWRSVVMQVSLPWWTADDTQDVAGPATPRTDHFVLGYSKRAALKAALVDVALVEGAAPDADADQQDEISPVALAAPEVPDAAATTLRYSPGLLARLNEINRQINGAIKAETDMASLGIADHWDEPLEEGRNVGDCEDYVLEKRHALIEAGFPAQALSIAVVQTRRGEDHAVLVVDTDGGDLVLDNLSPWVTPWNAVGYRWLMRQAPGQPLNWVSVAGASRTPPASQAVG